MVQDILIQEVSTILHSAIHAIHTVHAQGILLIQEVSTILRSRAHIQHIHTIHMVHIQGFLIHEATMLHIYHYPVPEGLLAILII